MPEGAVSLPTPEQERAAVRLLFIFVGLAAFGAAALLAGFGLALGKLAQWVWGVL